MEQKHILDANRTYWNDNADAWFGTTALPQYGVKFVTVDDIDLFGDVSGKNMLEVCCGSGHSIKYLYDRGAKEIWGLDISQRQLVNAERYLADNGYRAKLICSPMEGDVDLPEAYCDFVYSIYGMGWATDLQLVFNRVARALKQGGCFVFSWQHPLNHCVQWQDGALVFANPYFDESWFKLPLDDGEMILCKRTVSTYVNALADAGFRIERMLEQSDAQTMDAGPDADAKTQKARMLPLSFCIKARKIQP